MKSVFTVALVFVFVIIITFGCASLLKDPVYHYIYEQLHGRLHGELTDEQIAEIARAIVNAGVDTLEQFCDERCQDDRGGLCLICSDQAILLSKIGTVSDEAEIRFVTGSGGL